MTWQEYNESLTPVDRWTHCGNTKQHMTHDYDIIVPNIDPVHVWCVGTPRLRKVDE